MSVILKIKFPAGRYHATPWGRHVNEGVPEWPPSPWRLLRALVATWKRTCRSVPEDRIERILRAILAAPKFELPPARLAHTRHYMPVNRGGGTGTTLVFDTFVSLSRSADLFVGWPDATLAAEDESTLEGLLANLTSLGRAESWVEATLYKGVEPIWNCEPASASAGELVSVFCPDPATALGDEHFPVPDAQKLKKGKLTPEEHLFDCPAWHLCLDTQTIHEGKWSQVPGARWVSYARRGDAFTQAPPPKVDAKPRPRPTVARFALDGAVLPRVTETLTVADALRARLMGRFAELVRRRLGLPKQKDWRTHPAMRSVTLSGRDGSGKIRGSHDHAYFLPTDEDGDGRIDHLSVVATCGFTPDETAALDSLRDLRLDDAELVMQLVGLGNPGDFRSPLFGPAKVWHSATPFVVTRHVKTRGTKKDPPECRGIDGRAYFTRVVLDEELARWIERRGGTATVDAVSVLSRDGPGNHPAILQFRRARKGKPGDDGFRRTAGQFTLTFKENVPGPICLGHNSHFGLGLFLAAPME